MPNHFKNYKRVITVHPQYIKDANGKKSWVVLSTTEFDTIMEELEELEDIKYGTLRDFYGYLPFRQVFHGGRNHLPVNA